MNNTSTTLSAIFKFNAAFLCAVNVFFIFAGIILNSVVITSLWNSQLRRKLCYFMIFVQACFDLAVVVVIHPLNILRTISGWMSNLSINFTESHWTFCCRSERALSERARQHTNFVQLLKISILPEPQSMLVKSHFTNMQRAAI